MTTKLMPSRSPENTLLNERDAAEFLGLSARTLQNWRWLGTGPIFLKLGGAVKYRLCKLERFLENARRASTSAHSPPPD